MLSRFANAVLLGVLSVAICLGSGQLQAEQKDLLLESGSYLQQQRDHYIAARSALKKRHMKTYRRHLAKLVDYPLTPYLTYSELSGRLYTLPFEDVDRFISQQQHTYLGDRLLKQWLKTLAVKQQWQDYRRYYQDRLENTELQCYALLAELNGSNDEATKNAALDAVAALWNVGKSQPDNCDPLFKQWADSGRMTDELMWQRHDKAIKNRKRQLARYIAKKMSAKQKRMAGLYQEVDRYPKRIQNYNRFRDQSPQMQQIILHGINRLARRDSKAALTAWERYDAQQLFNDKKRRETQEYLILRLAKSRNLAAAEHLLQQIPDFKNNDIAEWLAREALRERDWHKVHQWLNRMPTEMQHTDRWRYWRARTLEALKTEDAGFPAPRQIYASLALKRSFYGFLSADILGHDYTLVDRPVNPPQEMMEAVVNLPGIRRAKELYDLKQYRQASREWFYTTRDLEPSALVTAGKLAEQWGWYRKTIQAMIETRRWDDLKARFPLAYQDIVDDAAEKTNIDPHLLFAIARQESAFEPAARSPAGALGLMQLMPATARQTAKRSGIRFKQYDLLKPDRNITLGSRYLDQLLDQFDGNRILATAAYNAGPHRVKKWLSQENEKLPYDIWIETIPFKETRGYVQNVLAFSVIYGYRRGNKLPFIRKHEANRQL